MREVVTSMPAGRRRLPAAAMQAAAAKPAPELPDEGRSPRAGSERRCYKPGRVGSPARLDPCLRSGRRKSKLDNDPERVRSRKDAHGQTAIRAEWPALSKPDAIQPVCSDETSAWM